MNPRIFIAILAFAAIFPPCANAQLFGRRSSCSTGYCAPHVHHTAPAVKQRDFIQQIFFAAPAGYIAPVGESVYGLSRALDLNAPDANAFLNNSNNHITAASVSTSAARQVSADTLAVESLNAQERQIVAKARGAADLVRAFANEPSGDQPRSLLLTMRNGQYESVREIAPTLPAQDTVVPRNFGQLTCLKCHSPEGSAATKFVIDEAFDEARFAKASAAIASGAMPPKSNLSEAEKARELLRLSRLVQ